MKRGIKKGTKLSKKHRLAIGKARKGIKFSKIHCKKLAKHMIGNKNPMKKQEVKDKVSKALKRLYKLGLKISPFKNMKRDKKWRKNQSKKLKKAQNRINKKLHKHHINLNKNDNSKTNILMLKRKLHTKLHQNAYHYLVKKGIINNYIRWFKRRFM